VPSFGEWGFTLAAHTPPLAPARLPAGLRFLNAVSEPLLFDFRPIWRAAPRP
jgi:spermidine synthase